MEIVRQAAHRVVEFWGHLGTFVKVAGTLTALIGIAVTVSQTYKAVSGYFAERAAVRDFTALAERQLAGRDYAAAWNSNAKALQLAPGDSVAQQQQIALAKRWLQNARISSDSGPKSFTALVAPLEEALIARSLKADAAARADIEAHIAWARFLRSRDGAAGLDIDGPVDEALRLDPQCTAAHAVKGFWLLWRRGAVAEARRHFDRAVAGTGDTAFADQLILAGWLNRARSDEEYGLGAVEYASRLIRRGRTLGEGATQSSLLAVYEDALRSRDYLDRLAGALVPTDHADLLEMLGRAAGRAERRHSADALRGYFTERSGDRAKARQIYEAVVAAAPVAGPARQFAADGLARVKD